MTDPSDPTAMPTALPTRRRLLQASLAAAPLAVGAGGAANAGGAAHAPSSPVPTLRIDRARLDALLRRFVDDRRVAGASALVWQGGAERYFGTAGHRDREAAQPMRRDTLVRWWSMTKPVAALALMRLWEAGRLRLDDPLSRHLPEFESVRVLAPGGPRPPVRPILVRDLLRHTAGLTYGMEDGAADRAFREADPFKRADDLADFSRHIAALPLRADPGTQWHYGTATDVLARLVEVLAGEPFERHVQAQVLRPLGLRETGWRAPAGTEDRQAVTYLHGEDGRLARQPLHTERFASGGAGLIGPIDDYLRFARLLLGEGALEGVRLLQQATVRLMTSDQLDPGITDRHFLPGKGRLGFGLGMAVRVGPPAGPDEAPGTVGEFFWEGMASTMFWVDPANELAAVFFTQKLPFDTTLHRDLRRAVYAEDGRAARGRPRKA